jgi:hypothetical protein
MSPKQDIPRIARTVPDEPGGFLLNKNNGLALNPDVAVI